MGARISTFVRRPPPAPMPVLSKPSDACFYGVRMVSKVDLLKVPKREAQKSRHTVNKVLRATGQGKGLIEINEWAADDDDWVILTVVQKMEATEGARLGSISQAAKAVDIRAGDYSDHDPIVLKEGQGIECDFQLVPQDKTRRGACPDLLCKLKELVSFTLDVIMALADMGPLIISIVRFLAKTVCREFHPLPQHEWLTLDVPPRRSAVSLASLEMCSNTSASCSI